jgi:hypothetical protein
MSFFEDLPAPPERPRMTKHVPPVWAAPPSDELPAVVSVGQFLQRTPRLVMAVKSVEVFSTGCAIEVVWTVRRGSETDQEWGAVTEACFNRPSYRYGAQAGSGGGLRFGVGYPDGRKATADGVRPWGPEGAGIPEGPVLMPAGGGGGSGSDDSVSSASRFWLWPLPQDGDLRIVAQWSDLGMDEQSVLLSGEALAAAGENVQKYWTAED